MITVELRKLEELISSKQQEIRNGSVRILKRITADELAFKTIECLDRFVSRCDSDDVYLALTSLACNIGKSVLRHHENDDDTVQKINSDRFKIGAWLLDRLIDYDVIKLVESRKGTEEHKVTVTDWELFFKLTISLPLNLDNAPVDTRPILEPLEGFKSFRSTLGTPMVRKCSRRVRRGLKRRSRHNSQVFDAINKQISTEWRVNTDLLAIYNKLEIEQVSNLTQDNLSEKGKETIELMAEQTLKQANEIADQSFWVMCYYDFRGRMYQSTSHLNYGSSKLAKSLFLLPAKPLGDNGLEWIKIHIANSFGYDKLALTQRVQEVDDQLDEWFVWIDEIDSNLDNIAKADDPYSFLAGLLELKRYYSTDNVADFVSGLPVAQDMTCSGLQILSMLSLDEVSASLCNLLPDTARGDYYLYIADNIDLFKKSTYWFKHKEDRRKLVKRSAMTYFYSCGAKTMGEHIWNDFRYKAGYEALTRELANELGAAIYAACRELMPGPTKLMDRFIQIGLEAAKDGKQLSLKMPSGFEFDQTCWNHQTRKIKVTIDGKRIECRVIVQKDATIKLRGRKSVKSSSSPNIVHGYDASLLSLIITANSYSKAVVHDSFAAAPGDSQQLFRDTRQTAIDIFSQDQLDNIGINDIERGKLIIFGLAHNEYFCS